MSNRDHAVIVPHDATIEQFQRKLERELRLAEVDKRATVVMLAANLSHQLGTPLSVIRGRAEHLLRQERNSPITVRALETIVNQVDRIAGTLKVLLDLSGRRELTRTLHDLRDLIRSSIGLTQTNAESIGVTFGLELGDAPLLVRCDPDQLQQLFINLIQNALEAMAEGGGALRVSALANSGAESRIRVVFENCGCRAVPDSRPPLFDPFVARDDPRGVGEMGLAVAQSIAREHDGEIAFAAGERGARLVLNLPLASSGIDEGTK